MDELDARLPLPDRALTLRELAAQVLETKLLMLPVEDKAKRAELLNNLCVAFSALGRREPALEAAEEAVESIESWQHQILRRSCPTWREVSVHTEAF